MKLYKTYYMRLPIIKTLVESGEFDEDYMEEAIEVLLLISEARGLKDEEMEVIGELISNISGAQEVMREIKWNPSERSPQWVYETSDGGYKLKKGDVMSPSFFPCVKQLDCVPTV